MKFGLHTGPQNCTFDELRRLWDMADESGLWWASVWDHFYPAQTAAEGDCFEAVATHAALAAHTSNVRVGCLVYCAAYRNPAILANVAATLDHLSGGRAELGLGAGWSEEEFRAYGIPFERPGVRLEQLDEAATIVKGLLGNERTTFEGSHFSVTDAMCNPKMVQPDPRLWIGVMGERALRIAAEHADGWNVPFLDPDTWGARNRLLSEHAETAGRDPGAIMRSVNVGLAIAPTEDEAAAKRSRLDEQFGPAADFIAMGTLLGTPAQAVDRIGEYQEAGADLVVVALRAPFDVEGFALFLDEVVPAFSS